MPPFIHRSVRPHDCPDSCGLLVTVNAGRAVHVTGDAAPSDSPTRETGIRSTTTWWSSAPPNPPDVESRKPDCSLVVPLLNEAETIRKFLLMLARQERIDFQVILSDGGSRDDTLLRAKALGELLPYDLTIITGGRGRGRQMNSGAAVAQGDWLLFIHADSKFSDPLALYKGLSAVKEREVAKGEGRTAGRFAIRFDTAGASSGFGYSFCEGKARLNRSGCILGDQGFLLSRKLLERVGSFDESLTVAEDPDFAERLRAHGEFILLPAEILSSPRRFVMEGYRSRQTLNALLMGLLFSGHSSFLATLPGSYQRHDRARRLSLEPIFREIARLISTLPMRKRLLFWYKIGAYVRGNIWQLAFALDLWRTRRGGVEGALLALYDKYLDRLTNHPPGRLLVAGIVWLWFFSARRWRWLREGKREDVKRAG